MKSRYGSAQGVRSSGGLSLDGSGCRLQTCSWLTAKVVRFDLTADFIFLFLERGLHSFNLRVANRGVAFPVGIDDILWTNEIVVKFEMPLGTKESKEARNSYSHHIPSSPSFVGACPSYPIGSQVRSQGKFLGNRNWKCRN